ncbi:MAG: hypothetical protein HDS68_06845 [Bacteroidales bacterium]|nr:hypothetical protein [Bacteroidales bacterium]
MRWLLSPSKLKRTYPSLPYFPRQFPPVVVYSDITGDSYRRAFLQAQVN